MKLQRPEPVDEQLRACLSAFPARPRSAISSHLPGFWERAAASGVAPLVAKQLGVAPAQGQGLVRAHAVAGIRSLSVLRRVTATLDASGIAVAPLKGPVLAARLYGDISLRPTSDVDVLIARSDLPAAMDALRTIGAVVEPSYEEKLDYHVRYNHHVGMVLNGLLVEIHIRASTHFGALFPSEPLLARARPQIVLGSPFRILEPLDEVIYLAVHAAGHYFERDILLLDIRQLISSAPLDWAALEVRARAFQVHRAVGAALVAAHERVGLGLGQMGRRWRLLSQAALRIWPEGFATEVAGDRIQAAKNLVADAFWSDSPSIGARFLLERAGFVAKERLRSALRRG